MLLFLKRAEKKTFVSQKPFLISKINLISAVAENAFQNQGEIKRGYVTISLKFRKIQPILLALHLVHIKIHQSMLRFKAF